MRSFGPSEEEDWHKFDDMLRAFDVSMPEELRLGELLDSVEVPASDLQVGDEVWMFDGIYGKWEACPVAGFGDGIVNGLDRTGKAYVCLYGSNGDFSQNPNNYPQGEMCRIKPRN